ncbi:P-loop containing nucleoside triphosphate hydrolase protein [Globomyces pollinis-pini]|nr:P-loop containing nucleoside triphosphate hydrolase protein [Globomyces pollinis-pini]
MKSDNEVEHLIGNSSNSKVGIVNRAFGAASIVLDEYELSHTGQTVKMEEPLSNVVTGSALKRSGNSDVKPTITKRQRKSKLSKKKKKSKLSDNDSDSEIDTSKPLWNLNVIAGEEFKAATEKSTESSIPEAKSIPPIKKPTPASLSNPSSKPAFHVKVNRPEAIQLSRMALPVVGEEQVIMEKVMENNVIILCGETGSGKTTQVPQFLYEAGFGDPSHPQFSGMIGITQPRRVAAVSMAKRVSEELNLFNGEVTYQVRYDKAQLGKNTRIKFMTDGILLRELSGAVQSTGSNNTGKPTDLLLSSYSCIIIDEAHERTVGTDILIGWLTRIVKLRNSGKIKGIGPLKLIIMSATLRVEDFTENRVLFPLADGGPPPVVKVDGRQHKVVIHYNKRTPELDFMADVYKKIIKIHTKLPHGGILVFVTGQQEVQILCRKLAQLHSSSDSSLAKINSSQESPDRNMFDVDTDGFEEINGANLDVLDDYDVMEEEDEEEEEQLEYLDGIDEEIADDATKEAVPDKNTKLHILPLYSLLPTKEQLKVFEEPPKGSRLVVIATNVAETSLTIPGIKYVVDCGKVKSRNYDTQTGIQKFQVMWTSSASADQRAGRAGRMGPGHCYRLFSSAVYQNYFEKFSKPEILRTPVEGIVLSMKSMGMNQVVGFPFPTPPNLSHLKDAESQLKVLDAIDDNMKITEVGRLMSQFPVKPRYARMIVAAAQHFPENLHYIIAIVSTLSVGEIF